MLDIRKAVREDAPEIHGMLLAMARDLGKSEDYRGSAQSLLAHGFDDVPRFEVLIARKGGLALGFILYFFEFSSWRGKPGLYVQDIYVSAAARGLGLGRQLLAAAVGQATQKGASYLKLCVDATNKDGDAFYRKLGFSHAASDEIMVLEGEPFAALSTSDGEPL